MSINKNNNTCRIKPRYLEHADFKEQPYKKQLIVFHKDKNGGNRQSKLFYWDVVKPSEPMIKLYEEKKYAFTDNLNKNISARLKSFDESGKSMTSQYNPEDDGRKPLTEQQDKVMHGLSEIEAPDKFKVLAVRMGLSTATLREHFKFAQKKGYTLEEFQKKK
jgi:hypothetical protein